MMIEAINKNPIWSKHKELNLCWSISSDFISKSKEIK